MYSTTSISSPHSFAVTMLRRIFNKPDSNNFSLEWLTLIDTAINEKIMNWAQILFNNLVKDIMEYRIKRSISSRVFPPFFMSAYVIDAIYIGSKFPIMGWKWIVQDPLPIHIYSKSMWDSQFHPHFYKICQGVMLPIHKQVYNRNTPRFSTEVEVDILP